MSPEERMASVAEQINHRRPDPEQDPAELARLIDKLQAEKAQAEAQRLAPLVLALLKDPAIAAAAAGIIGAGIQAAQAVDAAADEARAAQAAEVSLWEDVTTLGTKPGHRELRNRSTGETVEMPEAEVRQMFGDDA